MFLFVKNTGAWYAPMFLQMLCHWVTVPALKVTTRKFVFTLHYIYMDNNAFIFPHITQKDHVPNENI